MFIIWYIFSFSKSTRGNDEADPAEGSGGSSSRSVVRGSNLFSSTVLSVATVGNGRHAFAIVVTEKTTNCEL